MKDANPLNFWPVYEFRLPVDEYKGDLFRYADGKWIPDDGEYDLAFIGRGQQGAPMAWGIDMPDRQNILWSWCRDGNWGEHEPLHLDGNPWHYMLRDGETDWDGDGRWSRERHPNNIAYEAAMRECSKRHSCANGRGPDFDIHDQFISASLVRERDTKIILRPPENLVCMYCGPMVRGGNESIAVAKRRVQQESIEDMLKICRQVADGADVDCGLATAIVSRLKEVAE